MLTCLAADGHVLLEGVPGLGKTLLVRTLASCLSMRFSRVQFTPDLMPADILGTSILEEGDDGHRRLVFREGPVFTQILLADEINRATPRTQSALLEAMQERQVTTGGKRRPLPMPFFVLATQNPIEQEGTYPLPEAQLDRFFFKVHVPFPTLDELMEVMARTTGSAMPRVTAMLTPEELTQMRHTVRTVEVAPEIMSYAMRLVLATHPDHPQGSATARKWLAHGASPRGGQTLVLGARVKALLAGRGHASIEDVRAVALHALRHRIIRNYDAEATDMGVDAILTSILQEVPAG